MGKGNRAIFLQGRGVRRELRAVVMCAGRRSVHGVGGRGLESTRQNARRTDLSSELELTRRIRPGKKRALLTRDLSEVTVRAHAPRSDHFGGSEQDPTFPLPTWRECGVGASRPRDLQNRAPT